MICNANDCSNLAVLFCPTCQKLTIDPSLSCFCSQECFKGAWREHKKIHTDHTNIDFTFVFISTDPAIDLREIRAPLSGGLENDSVQLVAKEHLFGGSPDPFQMVDICTVYLPGRHNGYIGVSVYSSGDQTRPVNSRATEIVQACGHMKTVIFGDAYVSRCYDNEAEPWIRRDIFSAEVTITAPWVREAGLLNAGRNMDAYTSSGAASKAVHQIVAKGGEQKPPSNAVNKVISTDDWTENNQSEAEKRKQNQHKKCKKSKGKAKPKS